MKATGQKENGEDFESGISDSSDNGSGIAPTSESQSLTIEGSDSGERGTSEGNESLAVRRATGPRTQQGKEKSKRNSTTHAIFSKDAVIEGESRAEFENLLNGLRNYFQPEGTFEEIQIEKLATLFWRERRLIIAYGKADFGRGTDFLGFDERPNLELLFRYETTLNRVIDRVLNQLERLQRMRRGQPVLPPINLNVSSS